MWGHSKWVSRFVFVVPWFHHTSFFFDLHLLLTKLEKHKTNHTSFYFDLHLLLTKLRKQYNQTPAHLCPTLTYTSTRTVAGIPSAKTGVFAVAAVQTRQTGQILAIGPGSHAQTQTDRDRSMDRKPVAHPIREVPVRERCVVCAAGPGELL